MYYQFKLFSRQIRDVVPNQLLQEGTDTWNLSHPITIVTPGSTAIVLAKGYCVYTAHTYTCTYDSPGMTY